MKGSHRGFIRGASALAVALSFFWVGSPAVAARDDSARLSNGDDLFRLLDPDELVRQQNLRLVAERIVNERCNLVLVGDSIMYYAMSSAYMAVFQPEYGFRGYTVSGSVPDTNVWHGYTNARTSWFPEARKLDDQVFHLQSLPFTNTDYPDEENGNPGSAWERNAAPCNVARLSCFEDVPDGMKLFGFGSATFYNQVFTDQTFMTEPEARLRARLLWFDHADAMDFNVQFRTTVSEADGGYSPILPVPVERNPDLTLRWMDLPEAIELGDAARNLSRRTELVITTPEGKVEQPGDSMLLGAVRIWNEAREKGIQWGFHAVGGAQAREHTWVPLNAWRDYIEFQQADTYLIQLGVNDLFHGVGNSGVIAAEYIELLVQRIHAAHTLAQMNDPSIRDPLFLLVSNWDSHNPHSGPYLDNTEWRLLAEGQSEIAASRRDTAFVDLRAVVEEENGGWYFWRDLRLTDRIHPKGPYWHEEGSWWDPDPCPDGSIYFAQIVWDALRLAAHTPPPADGFNFPACACEVAPNGICICQADLNCDGVVNGADLVFVLNAWGAESPEPAFSDLNADSTVDGEDLTILLNAWGSCP